MATRARPDRTVFTAHDYARARGGHAACIVDAAMKITHKHLATAAAAGDQRTVDLVVQLHSAMMCNELALEHGSLKAAEILRVDSVPAPLDPLTFWQAVLPPAWFREVRVLSRRVARRRGRTGAARIRAARLITPRFAASTSAPTITRKTIALRRSQARRGPPAGNGDEDPSDDHHVVQPLRWQAPWPRVEQHRTDIPHHRCLATAGPNPLGEQRD